MCPPIPPSCTLVFNSPLSSNVYNSSVDKSQHSPPVYTDLSNIDTIELQDFQDFLSANQCVAIEQEERMECDDIDTFENPEGNETAVKQNVEIDISPQEPPSKKRKRFNRGKELWKRRMLGEDYQGRLYNKEMGTTSAVSKNCREMGPRCGGKRCDSDSQAECAIQCY
ncbi:LOW QUALITY PROTEIN: hypothetical protein ElyMa_004442500 [Elysia marginata]|uniref:Uncharacterized protein n=1 Tax=Elysia marginata TaxID=1093978 RepID=A0AAV4HG03_9GAST|nr:LOW QUALITY PROTEIN: hypothetical protein ElyMa_004442500 [Elysia marginata]